MIRGLIVGSLAFAAAFGAERLFASVTKDVARYDAIRAMSDQPPLFRQLLTSAGSLLGEYGSSGRAGATGIISGLTSDIVRYAKMKGM